MNHYAKLNNEEAERALIGCVLVDPSGYVLEDFLSVPTEAYWRERHKIIVAAIRSMLDQDEHVDMVGLVDYLRRRGELEGAGSIAYITGIANDGYSQATSRYAEIITDFYRRRKLLDFAGETVKLATDQATPIDETLGRIEQELTQAARLAESGRDIDYYADAAIASADGDSSGQFKTGISSLDAVVGGLKGLVILGARPSMGKSSVARDMLRYQQRNGRKVALFTQDQYGSDVLAFEASLRSRITLQKIKSGTAKPDEVKAWREAVKSIRDEYRNTFVIDDRPHNVYELATRIRSAARWGAELVAIDYLQLIDVPGVQGQHTVQATTLVSKTLKHLTQELNMPILALAQLSRAVETRNPPRPQLSDLRESGQIEQDAEAVIFLYREEYYRARAAGRPEELESYADLVVAKNKTGPTGTARTIFDSQFVTFRSGSGLL
jgi:replicative DNA helicase